MGKREFITGVLLVLIILLSLTGSVKAQTAKVFIDAPDTVSGGETFQAKVNITNVSGLYGWEFKFYYLNSMLNLTSVSFGPFLETGGTTFPMDNSDNNYNATHGLVWLADALLGAPSGVSGNGTLAVLNFTALNPCNVTLIFEDMDPTMPGKNIKLGDIHGKPIDNIAIDKFNAIPEFSMAIYLITMLAAASAAVLLAKKSKMHK